MDEPRWFALYLNWNCGTVYSPSPLTVNAPAVCDTVRLPQPPAVRVPKPEIDVHSWAEVGRSVIAIAAATAIALDVRR